MTIPNNLIIEKNKLGSKDPWLLLCKIILNDGGPTEYRLVRNPTDVYFDDGNGSELYTAFPFELETQNISSKGEISELVLKVCNITRLLQPNLETLNGAIGSTIKLVVVHFDGSTSTPTGNIADYADLTQTYSVLGCVSDVNWVVFSLGAPNPLRQSFPLNKYLALHCRWQFDVPGTNPSPECGYDTYGDGMSKTTCDRTCEACKAHDNSDRFGGFVGLQTGGIRIV